ncbi:unnamed protein product [Ambrosiozyma monospora]|uniref:Unnamed protein product n=1 Tax=Ambrosiozyma monospora TaxID=43982 RepID=A0ACB5SS31_AMBMO|nr:unnamed protein product [Ambrosiozyma monospora]
MDSFNRVSSSLEGIASPYLTETLQMILMADDVITTFKNDQDALKFKDLLYDFEKTSIGVDAKCIEVQSLLSMSRHSSVRPTGFQPSKLFKVTEEEVMTPLWLGGFGLINLSRQLHGRQASYIYAALTETCTPSTLNVRSILQTTLNHISISEYSIGKLVFSCTEKSEAHPSFAQSVTLDLNSLEAPDQELIKLIQIAGEATQITALSFSSRYYQAHQEEQLIVPSRAKDDDKTKWRTFWAFFCQTSRQIPRSVSLLPPVSNWPHPAQIGSELYFQM